MNDYWVRTVIKETKDFQELNKNECTIHPNLWDTMKVELREKFIALNAYIKQLVQSHTSDLIASESSRTKRSEHNQEKRARNNETQG